jgi:hypothetical protein
VPTYALILNLFLEKSSPFSHNSHSFNNFIAFEGWLIAKSVAFCG